MRINKLRQLLRGNSRRTGDKFSAVRSSAFSSRAVSWLLLFVMAVHSVNLPFAAAAMPRAAANTGGESAAARPAGAAQVTETFDVYGPRKFVRAGGAPTTVTESFVLPADAAGPFNVQLQNGAPDGSSRVSSATVKLNGANLFTQSDFGQQVGSIKRAVSLNPSNTLEVQLKSAPGSYLTITFTATRTQALPASLDSATPARATQAQSLSVTLRGSNTHWTQGQTRASLGEEVSVGGAAQGEPGPVTVTSATTAVAELVVSPTAALAPRAARVVTTLPGGAGNESVSLANALTVVASSAPGSSASAVTTLAGVAGSPGFADGASKQARFRSLSGIAVGPDDAIYVADAGNHRIRVVRGQTDSAGATTYNVSTLAGTGAAGYADGPAASAQFNDPQGVAVDASGVVYVADTDNHRIRRIAADGTVTTLAGDGTPGLSNGAGAQARFNAPRGIAVDNFGNVYVADSGNSSVRRVTQAGDVTTVAGDGTVGSGDSPAARFDNLSGIACDGEHVFVYLGDTGNHRVRRLDATGAVITVAGASRGFADGSAGQARFAEPSGLAIDASGKIVVADAINSLVRSIDPELAAGGSPLAVTTLAGTGERGGTDGAGNVARFHTPRGIAVSQSSAVFVADTGNGTIRRILLPPSITSLSPQAARPGEQISLLGERFDGRAPARNVVKFTRSAAAGGGQTPALVLSATRTAVTVEVPPDAASGPVTLQTEGGTATSPTDFTLATAPAPSISDFDPKHGPVGTTVNVTGASLRADNADPLVTFQGANGARLPALVTFSGASETHAIVPNGAVTGNIELTTAGGLATSLTPFTVDASQDFRLTVAPSSATAVRGGTATYVVSVNSDQQTFTQMARLSATGLPSGVTAKFEPAQITSGASSTLSVSTPSALSANSYQFTITAVAAAEGRDLSHNAQATLNVLAGGVTTLSGRVLSTEDAPIMGATVSLDGRTATTDAAGSFILSGVTAGSARPLMVDGRTASAPNRTYPVILEPANIVAGQANVIPYNFYLPPIDTQYEVQVVPGQNTVAGNPRVPGLRMTIPAGANLRNRDGSPVTRVSITPLAIDRTPTPLPSNVRASVVYTSQPGGALTDIPVPVVYPNLAGTDPGTRVNLYAFDHDIVQWYVYGTGTVSADGRTIVPDINPSTGRSYGLRDFSWHFPGATPDGNPGGGGDCGGTGPHPVNYSTGMKLETATDFSFGGARGGIALTRVYSNDSARTGETFGRFGRGHRDNFDIRLTGSLVAGGAGRVAMPDERTGRLFSYSRTEAGGVLVFTSTATVGQLGDTLRRLGDGSYEYRYAEGDVMRFGADRRLSSLVDRNGNVTTLTYTGSLLARVTDAVGRSVSFEYEGSFDGARVTRVTDPAGRVWRYAYGSFGMDSVTDPLGNVVRYTYDTFDLASVTDGRGNVVKRLTYDGNGRVLTQQFADGAVERYDYALSGGVVTATVVTDTLGRKTTRRFNASGYIVGVSDPLGQSARVERDIQTNLPTSTIGPCGCPEATRQFDASGNVTSQSDLAGQTSKFEYEPNFNNITKMTDESGRVTTYAYDARGNVTSVTNALGQTVSYGYDQFGQLTTTTDQLGHVTTMEYDAQGNVAAVVDALGHRLTMTYDGIGRLLTTTDPLGHTKSVGYDALSRVATETDPSGAVTTYTYDANSNLTVVKNAAGQQWKTAYDAKNRALTRTDPLGRTVRYGYDNADQLTSVLSPTGRRTQFGYDERGQRTSLTDPLGGVVRYAYDNHKKLVSVTDQRGQVTTFLYDQLFRPVGMRDPSGQATAITHDAAGNVTSVTDRMGRRTSIGYDALNRPVTRTYADSVVSYTYDAAGRLTRVDDTGGSFVEHAFDEANRMTSETTTAGTVGYTYNDAGQRLSMTAANRPPVTYGYDAAGRLETISQGGETFTNVYDTLSRRVGLQRPNGVTTTYRYDAAQRLVGLQHARAQVLEDYVYTYNAEDEITSVTSASAPAAPLPQTQSVGAADASNRITQFGSASFTFDNEGHPLTRTDAGGTTSYTWDARGRLARVSLPGGQAVSYTYDAMGRRNSRTDGGGTTSFLYDGGDVVRDLGPDGSAVDYLNDLGIDGKLRQSGPSGGALYFLQDHLNSTVGLTDGAGNLVERTSYGPFGETAGSSLTRYGFTGRERDAATGLMYYRARWYDPRQGRFISEDPIGLEGGTNLYAYVDNNPISFVDPVGLRTCKDILKDIWDTLNVLKGRADDLIKDPLGLQWSHWSKSNPHPRPGYGSVEGHQEQYEGWRRRLNNLLEEWKNNCMGKGGPPPPKECWAWRKRPAPEPVRRPNPAIQPPRWLPGQSPEELRLKAEAAEQYYEFWKKITIGGAVIAVVLTGGAVLGGGAAATSTAGGAARLIPALSW